jgi:hypothetical protein
MRVPIACFPAAACTKRSRYDDAACVVFLSRRILTGRGPQDDFRVEEQRKPKLTAFDQYLKKFQYRNAVDAALRVCALYITPLSFRCCVFV